MESTHVRLLRAEDAPQLVRCFERCYGDSYVADAFYDEARIRALHAAGTLRSVVAVSEGEGIVGHMALTIRHPRSRTVDAGNTVVDPRYRGQHLAARLAGRLTQLCLEHGFVGFHHYPTTAHPVMQKLAVQGGGIETGLMLGYIPAGTDYRELAGGASAIRLAAVIVYQPLAAAPAREVFVPERYRAAIERAYELARLERTRRPCSASLPAAATMLDSTFDARRSLQRVNVERAGADLREQVEMALLRHDADLVHVDFGLDDPAVGAAIELLRGEGFFFCGLLPEYLEGDVLRLQRLRDPAPAVLASELATDGGAELLAVISKDRAR